MLQKNIKEMFSDLAAVVEEMHSGKYDKADKSPKKMVEHIAQLTKSYKSCETSQKFTRWFLPLPCLLTWPDVPCGSGEDRSKRFAGYEGLFGLQETDYSKVHNALKELNWHSNKWMYLNDFMKVTEQWYNGTSVWLTLCDCARSSGASWLSFKHRLYC